MIASQWGEAIAVALAAALAFGLSAAQSLINASHGTDHAVHSFLIRAIRANRYRLFVRVPRLLNHAFVGALPLYLHWIFAHLPARAMRWAEKLLNPAMNGLHTIIVGAIAALAAHDAGTGHVALTALLFAATPQFYHALSARNFGLSARNIGLVVLTLFFLSAYGVEAGGGAWVWALLAVTGYLTFAFSTFGAQALVIVGVLLALLTGRFVPLAGAGLGLVLFIAIHPRYSLGYLRHTLRFIRAYAVELAPVYVLSYRYSIWRDLVRDIWARVARQPAKGLRYAYENSVLVVVTLNPLLVVAVLAKFLGWIPDSGMYAFAADVALCGAAATLLTSFRVTRFLGEPERYAEAVTAWSAVFGTAALIALTGLAGAIIVALAFVVLAAAQLYASHLLSKYLQGRPTQLGPAERAIADADLGPIRCCSNNEQLTKLLMHNDWDFSYCIAVGNGYCGMDIREAFSKFPFVERNALQKIVETYRINVCVLDRSQYETLFDAPPPALVTSRTIHQSEGLTVLALDWIAAARPSS